MRRRKRRISPRRPPLLIDEILRWADEWFASKGHWPNVNSGLIPGTIDDTWRRIDEGLRRGYRGLHKGSGLSLARLLERHRGVRNSEYPPKLSETQIVTWARSYHRRTGKWPKAESGAIFEAPEETWLAIDMSLRKGKRGVGPGSSLARLLASKCGVRNGQQVPRLTVTMILRWADAHFAQHGKRPTANSGNILDAPGETWYAMDKALVDGGRGLPGGSSLAKLFDARRPKWKSPRFRAALLGGTKADNN